MSHRRNVFHDAMERRSGQAAPQSAIQLRKHGMPMADFGIEIGGTRHGIKDVRLIACN